MNPIARCSICDSTTQPVNSMNSLSYTGATEAQVSGNLRAESHMHFIEYENGVQEFLCSSCLNTTSSVKHEWESDEVIDES